MTAEDGFCGVFHPREHFPHGSCAVPGGLAELRREEGRLPRDSGSGKWRPIAACEDADQVSIAWHGEIYNAQDLCRQLDMPAELPLPAVILAAWQRWSVGFLLRLNGVFALALRSRSELLLYRDASGLQNLFFHTGSNGRISYATNLQGLLRLPGVGRRIARRSLHEYLRFLDVAAPHTLFEDVIAVQAGQVVRWSDRGIETQTMPSPGADGSPPGSFAAAVEMLNAHLERSVQTRLAGSARPAAFLSGGVDSSLLCATAARQRGDITALTVGFDGAPYDEAPVAQRVAAHLGVSHQVLRFSREQYLAAFETLSQRMEQPSADPALPATVLAFDHCRGRFDMVLDGTGADEVVGNMPPRHVRLAVGYGSLLPASVRRALTGLLQAAPGLSGYAPIVDFEHPADTMIRWRGFTRSEIETLCGEPVSFEDTQFYRTFARFQRHAHFERYGALVEAMPCERLNQATLASGLTVRYPYWDWQTDRFIRQLRTDYRYLPGEPKRILRALLARYVPRPLWDTPKRGFDFPLQQFLSADDYLLVRHYLGPGRWQETAGLSTSKVQAYARQFVAGDQRLMFRVWALVVLGAWLEKHDESS